MTPIVAYSLVIVPTLDELSMTYNSPEARLMLLAIAIQEGLNPKTGHLVRKQLVGPARGFWQFEQNGGAAEFEMEKQLKVFRAEAESWGFSTKRAATMAAIGIGADHLACLMARAILWLHPAPLPSVGDVDTASKQYRLRWRPGAYDPVRFVKSYALARTIACV